MILGKYFLTIPKDHNVSFTAQPSKQNNTFKQGVY
jgi:hypothetical protein